MSSPLEMTELYDNALLGILQHVGNIQNFLQIYFGFLYRKTDFYRLLTRPNDKMGFPPGVAEKMVLKVIILGSEQLINSAENNFFLLCLLSSVMGDLILFLCWFLFSTSYTLAICQSFHF